VPISFELRKVLYRYQRVRERRETKVVSRQVVEI
jgi:hypothetical protein